MPLTVCPHVLVAWMLTCGHAFFTHACNCALHLCTWIAARLSSKRYSDYERSTDRGVHIGIYIKRCSTEALHVIPQATDPVAIVCCTLPLVPISQTSWAGCWRVVPPRMVRLGIALKVSARRECSRDVHRCYELDSVRLRRTGEGQATSTCNTGMLMLTPHHKH